MAEGRRRAERVTINKDFESFDQFMTEYVANVSASGVFIRTEEPLAVGDLVSVCFNVFMDGVQTIEGEGEVVRVASDPPGMGVVFRRLESSSQQLLESLLGGREQPPS